MPRLLELMENAPDFYFDSVSQVKMDSWSSGRAVLLGDAAYCASPLSGMGTGMAVVGAYVLAGELAEAAGDYAVAFERYESAMRGFGEEVPGDCGWRGRLVCAADAFSGILAEHADVEDSALHPMEGHDD